jgi:hypothetical protein
VVIQKIDEEASGSRVMAGRRCTRAAKYIEKRTSGKREDPNSKAQQTRQ